MTIKWRRRLQISGKGRVLYQMKQQMRPKIINFKAQKNQRTILQLQSGYSKLKEYRHKVGTAENLFCNCGDIENVEQYLLHCQEYEGPKRKDETRTVPQIWHKTLEHQTVLGGERRRGRNKVHSKGNPYHTCQTHRLNKKIPN